jgi:ketosteroid isomerase-like protein
MSRWAAGVGVTVTRIGGRGPKGSRYEAWVDDKIIRLISFKDGRIWRVKEFPTRANALEAAGLSEY